MKAIIFIMPTISGVLTSAKSKGLFTVKEVSVCATIYWFAGRGSPLPGLWQ